MTWRINGRTTQGQAIDLGMAVGDVGGDGQGGLEEGEEDDYDYDQGDVYDDEEDGGEDEEGD